MATGGRCVLMRLVVITSRHWTNGVTRNESCAPGATACDVTPLNPPVIDYASPTPKSRWIDRPWKARFAAGVASCAMVALVAAIEDDAGWWSTFALLGTTAYLQVTRRWTAFTLGVLTGIVLALVIAFCGLLWFAYQMSGF